MIPILLLGGLWLFKMELSIIAALSENNVIGIRNKIPWHIKRDMQRFRELTINHPVIMGRNTYESIPLRFRPLPQRKNIVLSSTLVSPNGVYVARTVEEALRLAEDKDAYIIGGRSLYESFIPVADKMEITRIHRHFEGDIYFPEVNWNEWKLVNEEKNGTREVLPYTFQTYSRVDDGI
jgi:dihydrofolate reductase